MTIYDVYDYAFNKVGQVTAEDAESALTKAKNKYPMVVAPMVEPTPDPYETAHKRAQPRNA